MKPRLRGFLLLLLPVLLLQSSWRAAAQPPPPPPQTDPVEAAAVNAILSKLGLSAPASWNISGNPCSGAATDDTQLDDNPAFNPAIKCDCSDQNNTICHVTRLKINELDAVGAIPEELRNLTHLVKLPQNGGEAAGRRSPPPSLGAYQCSSTAQSLGDLRKNYLTGPLPAFIGELTGLQSMTVGINALSGPIPKELGNLTNLLSLALGSNNFNGTLPDELGKLTKLRQIYIDSNDFSGPLPSTLSQLKNLSVLRIGEIVNGSSPLAFIGNMTSLGELVLRNSKISDTLASVDFSRFGNLSLLDLSFNNITGQIPQSILNLPSLSYLFLGNNSLSGGLPATKSPLLTNLYVPFSLFRHTHHIQLFTFFLIFMYVLPVLRNLVANDLVIDSSNNSVLPWGLDCLQRNTPCFLGSPQSAFFAVDCGGSRTISGADNSMYQADNASLGAASYYVAGAPTWGVSSVGLFTNAPNGSYILYSSRQFDSTLDSALFQTARMSPSSLRYYGIGLENGNYTVTLQFAEVDFPDMESWRSRGRRVFDIYVQGERKEQNFDIRKTAGGKSFTVVKKQYVVPVTKNFLEIHLFWAGKGTCCIPYKGYFGPAISALSATPKLYAIVGRPNVFSYSELRSATENFCSSNLLGEGGYGSVYKGKLSDGRVVAVKQLSQSSNQGKTQFAAEIETISRVQHRNLVRLYGCCLESKTPLLVYEYLENGSLDHALFGKGGLNLDWSTRFEICLGIARGIAYLHEESTIRIVHRDIKASNVLLDSDLNPKISDFGLAKLYDDNKTHVSTKVAGTFGYLAPEYAMRGHMTEKVDVFAFGVVALEIVAGESNYQNTFEEDTTYIFERVWELYENGRPLDFVDPKLTEYNGDEVLRVIRVALSCTQGAPHKRPSMSKVVSMLTGDADMGEEVAKPSYITEWQVKVVGTGSFKSSQVGSASTTQPSTSSVDAGGVQANLESGDATPVLPSPLFTSIIDEGR
nr:unnamed protein product [Digitaria exilis]